MTETETKAYDSLMADRDSWKERFLHLAKDKALCPSNETFCSASFAMARRLLAFSLAVPFGALWWLLFCFFIPLSVAWRGGSEKLTEDGEWFLGLLAKPLRGIRGANPAPLAPTPRCSKSSIGILKSLNQIYPN
jgi:hypothetical protein